MMLEEKNVLSLNGRIEGGFPEREDARQENTILNIMISI